MFKSKNLLTPNEQRFFYCLTRAVPKYHIAVQVSLSAMIESEYFARSQYRTYYADFVICDKQTFKPLLVIELDDRTHNSQKRYQQDVRKNTILHEANIPLYRMTAKMKYDTAEIKNIIAPILSGESSPPELPRTITINESINNENKLKNKWDSIKGKFPPPLPPGVTKCNVEIPLQAPPRQPIPTLPRR